jgi:hypothetical protein
MTRNKLQRGVAGLTVLAFALGPAGTAMAKPVDDPSSPNVAHPPLQTFEPISTPSVQEQSGGDSAWAYVAIGGGAFGLTVAGVGGSVMAGQRRRRRGEHPRSTLAA